MDHPNIMVKLKNSLRETMTPAESKKLLEAYSLSGGISSKQQYESLLYLSSDLRFYFPVLQVRKGWKGKANRKSFRYHFHQVSFSFSKA